MKTRPCCKEERREREREAEGSAHCDLLFTAVHEKNLKVCLHVVM